MAADEKWYFTKEQLQNTPSRQCGFDADKELSYRQQAANFIQDMGQKLQVSQLCINTAIVYMHRFYMFHSFTHFPWNTIAATSFFLAAKVEEQPRKLEHVIRIANHCFHREQPVTFDAKSEQYAAQSQDLVFNENVLLQTLGFDVAIDHPHTHVVRCCHLVRASKDLAQTSYFMASNSLHLTTMCLQYKPTVVACFCIHLACKWSNWQIPKSNEGKDWFYYVDKSVTSELLEQLTSEFLKIFDKCPSRLKRKISSISNINQNHNIDQLHAASSSSSPFDPDCRKFHNFETKDGSAPTFHSRSHHETKQALLATPDDPHKKATRPHDPSAPPPRADYREYREKKERERLEREKAAASGGKSSGAGGLPVPSGKHMAPGGQPPASGVQVKQGHHRPPAGVDPKIKMHHRLSDAMGHREHGALKDQQQQQPPTQQQLTNGRESRDGAHRDREHQKRAAAADYLLKGPDALAKQPPKGHETRHAAKYAPKGPAVTVPAVTVPASAEVSKPKADKNSLFNKPINSTSQRHKSPFPDAGKTVSVPPVAHPRNGSASTDTGKSPWPPAASAVTTTSATQLQPTDASQQQLPLSFPSSLLPSLDDPQLPPGLLSPPPSVPTSKKTSSLFSPEKTPPQSSTKKPWNTRTPPSTGKRSTDTPLLPGQSSVPPVVSPFGSPPPVPHPHPKLPTPNSLRRSRTSSSGSEPELRPVVKKLDQISGFENIIRDSKMGIKLPKVPDIIQPICDRPAETLETSISKELKPPDIIKPFNMSGTEAALGPQPVPVLVNGIDSDPVVISSLLKEVAPPPLNHLADDAKAGPTVDASVLPGITPLPPPVTVVAPVIIATEAIEKHKSEHHHKSEKKKKKDKHKHKDKDKSRDEKKKKHKDKDKERHKSKSDKTDAEVEVPLKITISKDKLQPAVMEQPPISAAPTGLKVKISKDRLKSDVITAESAAPMPAAPSALKIKISKDQIQYSSVVDNSGSTSSNGSRKRERDRSAAAAAAQPPPPTKVLKTSYGGARDPSRQNGRASYNNKVAQMGVGEVSQLRLAESKYHSKGAPKTS